jgi:hypothetical protein
MPVCVCLHTILSFNVCLYKFLSVVLSAYIHRHYKFCLSFCLRLNADKIKKSSILTSKMRRLLKRHRHFKNNLSVSVNGKSLIFATKVKFLSVKLYKKKLFFLSVRDFFSSLALAAAKMF